MNKLNNNKDIQVSVVIPMKNAEKFIGKTLDNILKQQNISFEIVVVDDQSTDQSANIVASYKDSRIRLVTGHGMGISEALNIGYRAASAGVIVRCDADDYLCPDDRLYKQVTFLNTHPSYQAVCGNFYGMDEHDNHLGSFNCGDTQMDITDRLKSGITKSSFNTYAIKKELFTKLCGFRSYFVTAEDIDFQLRIAEHAQVMYFAEHWYIYRLHSDSITHTQRESTKLEYEATARRFQTQRLIIGTKDDLEKGIATPIIANNDSSQPTSAKDHVINLAIANSWLLHSKQQKALAVRLLFNVFKHNLTSTTLIKQLILLVLK